MSRRRMLPVEPARLVALFEELLEALDNHRFVDSIGPRDALREAGIEVFYWPKPPRNPSAPDPSEVP